MFFNTMIRFFKTAPMRGLSKLPIAVLSASVMAAAFFVGTAHAAPKPETLGTFSNWVAYSYNNGSSKVCYIVSQPASSSPKGLNRDPAFFLVTHRPGDKVRNEVNTIIGYPFKKGSNSFITIDKATGFKFFTSGDGAWAGSKEADSKVVKAMKAGSNMVVVGHSGRGTKTIDKYSLSGVSAAMKAIDAACK